MAVTMEQLAAQASPEAVALARLILEHDLSDRAWAAQIGPAATQRDTARLLGKSEQAVSKDARLVRVHTRDGRPVYPLVQFNGRSLLPGVGDVVAVLAPVVATPLSIAAWLTGIHPELAGRRPVDVLRSGSLEAVLDAARRFAATAV
jgi:hypothetical protein